jgi:signal transduction histidine kinase
MNASATIANLEARDLRSPRGRSSDPEPMVRIHAHGVAVIALVSLALAGATASECHSILYFPSVLYGLVLWGWWGFLAATLWTLGFKTPAVLGFTPRALVADLILGCSLGVVHLLLLGSLGFTSPGWRLHGSPLSVWTSLLELNRFGLEILIYGFVLGMIGIVHFQMRAQRDAMRSLELQKQLSEAQLRALQMQLEPHFLFNTLNAITTLVELGRQQQAAEMLGHLNVILKRTLERSTPEKIPLAQELEIVENYLAIEQVRFADRLRIDIKIDPGALHSLVPCFLLQPIVENAIRHGIANCEGEGTVEASARREGNRLRISVRDTGPGKTSSAGGNGIGLKNTRDRLAYFYPQEHTLLAGPSQAGGFEVAIDVPYEVAG